ncbi:S-adenosylmethionine decarboxylase family protein [Flavobacterium sp. RS13.1]|jgi:S-adenosylmethionine decarboxylase|uniref:S-adenosylmethionine decarboxylase family protein n=1 Tax=Flavobacterium sp. RS13.1 TaxID=3400345 RepID=UPI003AAC3B55
MIPEIYFCIILLEKIVYIWHLSYINNGMDLPPYSPGLHKLVTLHVDKKEKLTASTDFVTVTNSILEKYSLEKVGVVVHDFENSSFTISFCLKESHICIHTWPEYNQLTLDVYLCNYLQDNSQKVRSVVADYIAYFEAKIIKDFEINR